jgi:RimJ/RimL family protein N-acetyltransferase
MDDDHEFLVELHNDPQVLKNLTHPEPITMDQHLAWWSKIRDNPNQLRLIFEVAGERCGFTKFYDIDTSNRNCTLGGDIHKDFRGRGYAKYMWTLMLHKCFDDLNLYRVGLTTAEYNEVGQRVYRKLGFKEEGRLVKSLWRNGQYYDQLLMYMLKPTWDAMEEQT